MKEESGYTDVFKDGDASDFVDVNIKMVDEPGHKLRETGTSDPEKLIRYRCAQSLFNISMDLKQTERMASNVCLVVAKGLIADLKLPEPAVSMHTPQTIHNSDVSEEVEAMAEKIREEINSSDAPHAFLSELEE